MYSAENSTTTSKKNTNILQIISQKNEGTFLNTFHKAEINLIAKLYKSPLKKKIICQYLWLTRTQKFSIKYQQTKLKKTHPKYCPPWSSWFHPRDTNVSVSWICHINIWQDRNHTIISLDAEKLLMKSNIPSW